MGTKAPSPFFSRVSGNTTSQKMAERMLSDVSVRGDISTFVFECLWPHVLIFVTRCWDSLQLNTGCFKPFVQTEPGRTAEQRSILTSKSMKPLDISLKRRRQDIFQSRHCRSDSDSGDGRKDWLLQSAVNSLLTCSVSLSWNYAGFQSFTSPGTKSWDRTGRS